MPSSMVPNARDRVDAHGDLDQDVLYHHHLSQSDPSSYRWSFETVDGFFTQSSPRTDDMAFDYVEQDFGATRPWNELVESVSNLNASAEPNTRYKVFFLARHGQGWHNVISQKYSKEEWMSKWRFLGTDEEITWGPDAALTDLGIQQAYENRNAWNHQIERGAPIPTKFYVSPLSRSINTFEYTWEDQSIPRPLVLENFRETMGVHLCHKRSTRSELLQKFPFLDFEPGFAETDELFESHTPGREELHEQFLRVNRALQSIFDQDTGKDTFISVTSHAGTMRSFITVVGHRKFTIPTGGMIPILVKATRND